MENRGGITGENFELDSGSFKRGVIDIVDPTLAPPTSNNGDRYILDNVVGLIHAGWGTVHKNDIVEHYGTQWNYYTPNEGWEVYVDFKNNTYVFVNDPPTPAHWETPTSTVPNTTYLTITDFKASGSTYDVTTSGPNYVKSGVNGNLDASATLFNTNTGKQIYLNGTMQHKGTDVIWASATTFVFNKIVYTSEELMIIS